MSTAAPSAQGHVLDLSTTANVPLARVIKVEMRKMVDTRSGLWPAFWMIGNNIGSVGWPGAYGGWWSADPVKKTISIFLTHSMTEPKQLGQGIGLELYEAIDMFSNYSKENI